MTLRTATFSKDKATNEPKENTKAAPTKPSVSLSSWRRNLSKPSSTIIKRHSNRNGRGEYRRRPFAVLKCRINLGYFNSSLSLFIFLTKPDKELFISSDKSISSVEFLDLSN